VPITAGTSVSNNLTIFYKQRILKSEHKRSPVNCEHKNGAAHGRWWSKWPSAHISCKKLPRPLTDLKQRRLRVVTVVVAIHLVLSLFACIWKLS